MAIYLRSAKSLPGGHTGWAVYFKYSHIVRCLVHYVASFYRAFEHSKWLPRLRTKSLQVGIDVVSVGVTVI